MVEELLNRRATAPVPSTIQGFFRKHPCIDLERHQVCEGVSGQGIEGCISQIKIGPGPVEGPNDPTPGPHRGCRQGGYPAESSYIHPMIHQRAPSQKRVMLFTPWV